MTQSPIEPNYFVSLKRGATTIELMLYIDETDRRDMHDMGEAGFHARQHIRLQVRTAIREQHPELGLRIVLWQQLELTPLAVPIPVKPLARVGV